MTRHEYDSSQSLVPGSWQNRQGREHEWQPAGTGDTWLAWGVAALGVVAILCAVVNVAFQVWRP